MPRDHSDVVPRFPVAVRLDTFKYSIKKPITTDRRVYRRLEIAGRQGIFVSDGMSGSAYSRRLEICQLETLTSGSVEPLCAT